MFTGIVSALGRLVTVEFRGGDRRLYIEPDKGFLKGVKLGDSIACSGVCLTVAGLKPRRFAADVSVETLSATTASAWRPDRKSTRLNSSHPSISYAVFCLKKKNTTTQCHTKQTR